MDEKKVRVRFAPAPTGTMHLGNVRTALMNYLFAVHNRGEFIIRIEDTDTQRNFDPNGSIILQDLAWLNLHHHEGPDVGGPHAPYIQSQRTALYDNVLQVLLKKEVLYRCFCTTEELDLKRKRQQALKQPPRYDRTCLALSGAEIEKKIATATPCIWRVKLDQQASVTIFDMAHKTMTFHLKHFSDFPITRQDGSYTFLFANFVDDMNMEITHVFRGEDHLSNTACQAALYAVFNKPTPIYWHMPIICTIDGKKLSKRDFGFSLHTLQEEGYVPEAIGNYLALLGSTIKGDHSEVMSLEELAATVNLEHPPVTGQIKYDVEKLRWMNHKWLSRYSPAVLARASRPFLITAYSEVVGMSDEQLGAILHCVQTDLVTLKDSVAALYFYFVSPVLTQVQVESCIAKEHVAAIKNIVDKNLPHLSTSDLFVSRITADAKQSGLPIKVLFCFLRLVLMGAIKGPAINVLLHMLGTEVSRTRIRTGLNLL